MKIRKTITPKVVSANQKNGRQAKGPVTVQGKRNSSRNAIKLGLFAKVLNFANDQEKADLEQFRAELTRQLQPRDLIERMMIEEIVADHWKLQACLGWEMESVIARRGLSGVAINGFIRKNSELDHDLQGGPLFDGSEDALKRTSSAWDCTEMSIETDYSRDNSEHSRSQTGRSADNVERSRIGGKKTEASAYQGKLEGSDRAAGTRTAIKLQSSLDTVMSREKMIKQDLDRAMKALKRWRAKESAD